MSWRLVAVVAFIIISGVTIHRFWPQGYIGEDPGAVNRPPARVPPHTAAPATSPSASNQEDLPDPIPGYAVRVHATTSEGAGGDVLVIYHKESAQGQPLARDHWKRSFQQLWAGRSVKQVAPWTLPIGSENNAALLVTLEDSRGTTVEFVILAPGDDGRFSQALHVASAGAVERPLEVADVDNDGKPEVIVVPQYQKPRPGYDPEDGLWRSTAQIWKWNPRHRRYEMVSETSYRRRLKPI